MDLLILLAVLIKTTLLKMFYVKFPTVISVRGELLNKESDTIESE